MRLSYKFPYFFVPIVGGSQVAAMVIALLGVGSVPARAATTVLTMDQWSNVDIGTTPVSGSGIFNATAGIYTVKGSGADIWGAADNFHYSYQTLGGDGVITARVDSVTNTNAWAKVGVMIRETLVPGSTYAMMMVTPSSGVGLQYRAVTGSSTSVNVMTTGLTAPRWIKLERRGNVFSGYQSADAVTWVLSQRVAIAMAANVNVGLVACSHVTTSTLTTAVFSQVLLDPTNATMALPWPWAESAVGTSTDQGVALYDSSYVLSNLGADIWSPADRLKFVGQSLTGDGTLILKVSSIASSDSWSRFGLMMRETLDAGAKNVLLSLTTGNGLVFQSRSTANGNTAFVTSSVSKSAPVWLKLDRKGSTFTASYSADGVTWTTQGSAVIAMNATIQVGVAYANRSTTSWAFGVGDQLKLVTPLDTDGDGLADAWEQQYFGHLGVSASADSDGDGLTNAQEWELGTNPTVATPSGQQPSLVIVGGNSQIGSTGSVLPQPLVVKVVDANTGAPLPGLLVSFQITTGQGALGSGSTWQPSLSLVSDANGLVQANFQFSSFGGTATVQAAVGSQPTGIVSFALKALLGASGSAFQLDGSDIGAVNLPNQNQYQAGTYTLSAATGDMWNTADSMDYAWQTMPGDGLFIARVASLAAANSWVKAGLMIRESLAANSRSLLIAVTPGNGVAFQWRDTEGGSSAYTNRTGLTAPQWLALRRSGGTIAGYYSADGQTWTLLASRAFAAVQPVYVGLAYASQNATAYSQAVFDSVSVSPLAPAPWQLADVGSFNAGNLDQFTAGSMLVRAGGNDIWRTADAFRYVYQPLPADGGMVVRVATQTNTNSWAKSGLMIRDSSAPGSRYVMLMQTPANGISLQTRSQTGASASIVSTLAGPVAPSWLKLVRLGSVVNAYGSADGISWTQVGSVNWGYGASLIGLAASSLNTATATATLFDNISLQAYAGQSGWSGAYFFTKDLSGPAAVLRRDASIDFTWPVGQAPAPGAPTTNYSVRWQGSLQPQTSDTYTFTVLSNGGVRLWVDGALVINRWALQSAPVEVSGQAVLQAGSQPKVVVEYFKGTDAGRIQLRWSNSTLTDAVIAPGSVQPADSDNDGIPDARETSHGLNPLDSTDALLAPDGDGLTNLAKYQLGLAPGQKADRVSGGAMLEEWRNLSGGSISDLTNSSRFPGSPDARTLLTSLETIPNHGQNYGERIRGYIVAPADGVYQFWIAADDVGELWLSPTDSPFDRVKTAWTTSYTSFESYDENGTQKSAPVTLQAGHYYYFEVLQKQGPGRDSLSVAWTRPGAPREVIGSACLATFAPRADDVLGDGLPDAWKTANGLDLTQGCGLNGAYGDPDGDGLNNLAEYQTHTNPNSADTDGDGASDSAEFILGSNPLVADVEVGIPAPWLSGSIGGRSLKFGGHVQNTITFWTDAKAFETSSDSGGIIYQSISGDFTCDGSILLNQISPMDLEGGLMVRASLAGNAPFISITRSQKSGWIMRYREFADSRVLRVNLTGSLDANLTDVMIQRVGSIISIYGQISSGVRRKLADYPLNLGASEAIVGFVGWGPNAGNLGVSIGSINRTISASGVSIDASLVNFDSAKWIGEWDGIALPELQGASHIPKLSELADGGVSLTNSVMQAGSSAVSTLGAWTQRGGSLVAQDRRGEITWQVNITTASVYMIEMAAREGTASKTETSHFPLKLFVDGQYVDTRVLDATPSQTVSALWFSPWLPSGQHTIRVVWDGAEDYTLLQVDSMTLYQLGGEDADGNGVPDWIDRRLQLFNGIDASSGIVTSAISPLAVEGRARWSALTTLTASGSAIPVTAGAGYRWFSEIPLDRNLDVPVAFSGENGAIQRSLTVRWSPYNVLSGGYLNMKAGSHLLASVSAGLGETASLTCNGSAVTLDSGVTELVFSAAGTYHLVGHVSGPEGVREVDTVVTVFAPPTLPTLLAGLVGRERVITSPILASGVTLEADPRLDMAPVVGSTTQIAWQADDNVNRRMIARIGAGGPILAATDVSGTAIYSGLETYTKVVETLPDGTMDTETLVIMSPVRPDHAIRLDIIVGGVVFSDGTRVKILTPADLDSLGQARVHVLRPPGTTTSVCHQTELTYQSVIVGTK